MCKWGTDVEVENLLTADGNRRRTWKIDACIAPIVRALNEGGVETIASCCGHGGKQLGRISLLDGRDLVIASTAGKWLYDLIGEAGGFDG